MITQLSQVYNFPYEPYPEQQKLMHSIYECIESSSVGCFESPTGTGKSLSAICASFDWLLSEEKRILDLYAAETTVGVTAISPPDDSDWLSELYTPKVSKESTDRTETVKRYNAMLEKVSNSNEYKPRSSLMLSREHNQKSTKKNTTTSNDNLPDATTAIEDEDAEFALKHYDSEDEAKTHRDTMHGSDSDQSDSDESTSPSRTSKRTPKVSIMDKLQLPQIFYCSRTHSQLAQFIAEMNKTVYTQVDPVTKLAPIRCVTLGSRRNLCVNENVTKLKSERSMSESCLEMQKKGSRKVPAETGNKRSKLHNHSKCPYHNQAKEKGLSMKALATVQDIEDIRNLGETTDTCAYYATRASVHNANVVCLPYNLLLNKDMRKSLGLNLTGKVIIIDEAHNLIETINSLYSAELNVSQIDTATSAISTYMRRFSTLLSPKNLYYVNILSSVLAKVKKVLCPKIISSKSNTTSITACSSTVDTTNATMTVNDFLFKAKLDNINLFKLRKHILDTNLVNKIGAYAEALAQREAALTVEIHNHQSANTTKSSTTNNNPAAKSNQVLSALRSTLELVTCLTNLQGDGRIFMLNIPNSTTNTSVNNAANSNTIKSDSVNIAPPTLRYVMLNPSVHFLPLLTQARSVVLLGGTMQPFTYFTSLLLPSVERSRLRLFSCEHVVPATQVGAIVVPHSYISIHNNNNTIPTSQSKRVNFEFTYATRSSIDLTNALFYTLLEICENTPGGVVVFCTSFNYLDILLTRWRNSKLLFKLDAVKRVFAESRSGTNYTSGQSTDTGTDNNNSTTIDSDHVWESYKTHVTTNPVEGAILFSVINGKLSEGINFSDYLARCVVVVGMPYPDTRDVILQEKMKYVSMKDGQDRMNTNTITSTSNNHNSIAATTTTSISTISASDVNNANTHYNTPAGRKLCENMCMRAVNQSVGRAIRHINDYACVVLLDKRYTQEHMRAQLPKWLVRNLQVCSGGLEDSHVSSGSNAEVTTASSNSEAKLGQALKVFFNNQKKTV
eukprot:gene10605-12383_t